jgi:diapolycopene oxygenase
MSDYIPIQAVRPHWRNIFEDGTVLDLYPEPERMAEEARKVGENLDAVEAFLRYSARLYDLVDCGYFRQGLDTAADFRAFYGLAAFPQFDLLRTMHGGVARHLRSRYFRDVFDFFVKYVGSSAYRAPAFMNCLPTIQFRHDLWYVDGGMYNIARGLGRLMQELGIAVHVGTEVAEIRKANARVTGVALADGITVSADVVVCNMEVVPAYRQLLREDERFLRRLRKFEPACSGLVIDLGLDTQYPQLAHHNFFFSGNMPRTV